MVPIPRSRQPCPTRPPDYDAARAAVASSAALKLGDFEIALELLGQCRDIQATSLGEGYPTFANKLLTMAHCRFGQGESHTALGLLERCATVYSSTLGDGHPNYRVCLELMQQCLDR